jgi:hypothetical protein
MDVCVHEAGHALALWYLSVLFAEVRVCARMEPSLDPGDVPVPAAEGAVTGFDLVPPRRDWLALASAGDAEALARGRAATEMEMFAAYAGPCAQGRYRQWWVVRRAGEPPVRRSGRLCADTILYGGGGWGDWSLIETDVADWPEEGVAMAARARRLAEAFVRGRAAWGAIRETARRLSAELRLGWDDVAAIAARHFGRPPPVRDDWLAHWPPLALTVRGGFLPPQQGGMRAVRRVPLELARAPPLAAGGRHAP